VIILDDIGYQTFLPEEFADYFFNFPDNYQRTRKIAVHVNLRNYFYLNRNPQFREQVKEHCIVLLEGIGIKTGLWLSGLGWLSDLNGTDLFPVIMKRISRAGIGIYLLGSKESVIQKAAERITQFYPGVNIKGFHNGYFGKNEESEIIRRINNSGAKLLIIGRGFPMQEEFVLKYKEELDLPLIWNVGGLFDFISGKMPRAPKVLLKLRLEWLYRFFLEPRRMLHRNTVCAVWSFVHLFWSKKVCVK
jgi:N-acetylglucosaminyldiphosphoundecaprenol N-acetyl-beta-D-mannosaminyltransferase